MIYQLLSGGTVHNQWMLLLFLFFIYNDLLPLCSKTQFSSFCQDPEYPVDTIELLQFSCQHQVFQLIIPVRKSEVIPTGQLV